MNEHTYALPTDPNIHGYIATRPGVYHLVSLNNQEWGNLIDVGIATHTFLPKMHRLKQYRLSEDSIDGSNETRELFLPPNQLMKLEPLRPNT